MRAGLIVKSFIIRVLITAVCLFGSTLLFAATPAVQKVCPLDQAEDPYLQQKLEEVVSAQKLGSATQRGDLALSLLILSDPEHPRLAQINGHKMLYAASLPKIAILLAAAVSFDEGRLNQTPAMEKDIHDMMRISCNQCANRVIRQVGQENLLAILQDPRYAFYDPEAGGGIWLGKEYGPHLAWRRDPLFGLSHGATTFEVARFYCGLQSETLVSGEQSRMMLDALSKPGIKHKFVKALAHRNELELFRKSGTWLTFHADSILVRSGTQAYVLVALAHDINGARWLEQLAEPLNNLALAQPAP